MKSLIALFSASSFIALACASPVYAETLELDDFIITLDDGAGSWNDKEELVRRAFNYWSNTIEKAEYSRKIKVSMSWRELEEGVLGQAGVSIVDYGTNSYSTVEKVWRDGVQVDAEFDFSIEFSTKYNFSFSASGDAKKIDFYSVLLHEIGHNFGFSSSAWATYDDKGNVVIPPSWGTPTTFDSLMLLKSDTTKKAIGSKYTEGTDYVLDTTGLGVYNPEAWEGGSSMSHVTGDDNALMQYAIGEGVVRNGLSAMELDLMRKMGWTVIPEPSMFGLLAGLSALALVGSRRRRK